MSLTKVAFRSSHSVEMAALGEHHFLYNFHCCFVGWVDISFASLSLKETVKVVLSRVLAEPQIFHRFPSIGQTQREGEREGERERHLAALQPMNARDQNQEKATYGAPPTDRPSGQRDPLCPIVYRSIPSPHSTTRGLHSIPGWGGREGSTHCPEDIGPEMQLIVTNADFSADLSVIQASKEQTFLYRAGQNGGP